MKKSPSKKYQSRRILLYLAISIVIAISAMTLLSFVLNEITSISRSLFVGLILIVVCIIGLIIFMMLIAMPMMRVEDILINIDDENADITENKNITKNVYLRTKLEGIVRNYKRSVDREYSTRILKQQAELSNLQSQINPHFLYNTLEAIRGKALLEDADDIAEMAEALASLFRYSISRKGDLVTIEEELNNLDNYILIQQYRFSNKFKITYQTEDEALLYALIPRMSIQPLVENSIYHGLETRVGQGFVDIKIIHSQDRIIISVKDNGVGIPEEKLRNLNTRLAEGKFPQEVESSEMGIALLNVNKRLKMYFDDTFGLKLYSTKGYGTEILMEVPYQGEEYNQ